jgi:hypothetical protein
MAAINGTAKASSDYGPLQTSALSDEANTTVTSRKKKVLRRAGAVNYDEDNDSDEEIGGS